MLAYVHCMQTTVLGIIPFLFLLTVNHFRHASADISACLTVGWGFSPRLCFQVHEVQQHDKVCLLYDPQIGIENLHQ